MVLGSQIGDGPAISSVKTRSRFHLCSKLCELGTKGFLFKKFLLKWLWPLDAAASRHIKTTLGEGAPPLVGAEQQIDEFGDPMFFCGLGVRPKFVERAGVGELGEIVDRFAERNDRGTMDQSRDADGAVDVDDSP